MNNSILIIICCYTFRFAITKAWHNKTKTKKQQKNKNNIGLTHRITRSPTVREGSMGRSSKPRTCAAEVSW